MLTLRVYWEYTDFSPLHSLPSTAFIQHNTRTHCHVKRLSPDSTTTPVRTKNPIDTHTLFLSLNFILNLMQYSSSSCMYIYFSYLSLLCIFSGSAFVVIVALEMILRTELYTICSTAVSRCFVFLCYLEFSCPHAVCCIDGIDAVTRFQFVTCFLFWMVRFARVVWKCGEEARWEENEKEEKKKRVNYIHSIFPEHRI